MTFTVPTWIVVIFGLGALFLFGIMFFLVIGAFLDNMRKAQLRTWRDKAIQLQHTSLGLLKFLGYGGDYEEFRKLAHSAGLSDPEIDEMAYRLKLIPQADDTDSNGEYR